MTPDDSTCPECLRPTVGYLLVSEAELAAALGESGLIRRYDEYSRDAHPETMRPTPLDELARTWAAAIFAALVAAQEKGETG